jgi:phosphoribulokinase
MYDYVHYVTPQFSRSHIDFQRVPVVDTSNPFIARDIPTPDESLVVIRFRDPKNVDFPYFLSMIQGSFMSRPNTIVVPGGKMGFAMEIILTPIIYKLLENKKKA